MNLSKVDDKSRYNFLKRRNMTKLQSMLEEFQNADQDMMELIPLPGEYSSMESMAASVYKAIKRSGYPMQVHLLKGQVFLVKNIGAGEES